MVLLGGGKGYNLRFKMDACITCLLPQLIANLDLQLKIETLFLD